MQTRFYTEEKGYTIYALRLTAEEDFVYVGKTTSRRISAIFSWHLCGNCAATDGYFSKEERPELYILREGSYTGAQAYKQVLAWVYVFQKEGYAVINHEKTLEQAENPNDETQFIIDTICREPLAEVLSRTHVARPVDADKKDPIHSEQTASDETVQMNIRMKKRDKERFRELCEEYNVNQRECISILLDLFESGKSTADFSLILEYQARHQKIKEENEKLKKQNALLRDTTVSNRDYVAEKILKFNRKGIGEYLKLLFPEKENEEPLPGYSYRRFMKRLPDGVSYAYPEEGAFSMELEAVLWSGVRSKACFLIGANQEGKRIKLRYYPKWYYTGYSFLNSTWAKKGTKWYVGCCTAKDGAMEMVFGFPLECTRNQSIEQVPEDVTESNRKQSLDSMIASAVAKHQ